MAKPIDNLRTKMSKASLKEAKERSERMLLKMDLRMLRENVAKLNQNEVAALLEVTQAHVSQLEHRGDMLVSTLVSYVEALGGEVEISAVFEKGKKRVALLDNDTVNLRAVGDREDKKLASLFPK